MRVHIIQKAYGGRIDAIIFNNETLNGYPHIWKIDIYIYIVYTRLTILFEVYLAH